MHFPLCGATGRVACNVREKKQVFFLNYNVKVLCDEGSLLLNLFYTFKKNLRETGADLYLYLYDSH